MIFPVAACCCKMEYAVFFTLAILLIFSTSTVANGQISDIGSPAPAPAPAPEYVNLEHLLSVAGPFHTFLNYLESTKVLETFQNQANNTHQGITIFVPKDDAFAKLKKPTLSNLTGDQLRSLFLFHALPHYYNLADFRNLIQLSTVSTFAGGELFSLNFTDQSGTAALTSGWTSTRVTSAVHASFPVAVYEVDMVLLPEAIFGTDIPPTPAPAPAPDVSPSADSPTAGKINGAHKSASATTSSAASSSHQIMSLGFLGMVGGFALLIFS